MLLIVGVSACSTQKASTKTQSQAAPTEVPTCPALPSQPPNPKSFSSKELTDKNFPNRDDLIYADFEKTNLNGADFTNTSLAGADLRDADLTNAKLATTDLNGAELTGATLNSANLSGNNTLKCAKNLNKIKSMTWAVLSADPTRAATDDQGKRTDLAGVDLTGKDLAYADLKYVNLTGAILKDTLIRGTDLSGAILDNANLDCVSASWRWPKCITEPDSSMTQGPYLSHASLKGTSIKQSMLAWTNFTTAQLNDHTNFDGTILYYALFSPTQERQVTGRAKRTAPGCDKSFGTIPKGSVGADWNPLRSPISVFHFSLYPTGPGYATSAFNMPTMNVSKEGEHFYLNQFKTQSGFGIYNLDGVHQGTYNDFGQTVEMYPVDLEIPSWNENIDHTGQVNVGTRSAFRVNYGYMKMSDDSKDHGDLSQFGPVIGTGICINYWNG